MGRQIIEQAASLQRYDMPGKIIPWMQGAGEQEILVPHGDRVLMGYRHKPISGVSDVALELPAHPDDHALFAGAQQKIKAGLVFATANDGRAREYEGEQYGKLTPDQRGEVRIGEDRRGHAVLDASTSLYLGFKSDGWMHLEEAELTDTVANVIYAVRPKIILLPNGRPGEHRDHQTINRSGTNALRKILAESDLETPVVLHSDSESGHLDTEQQRTLMMPLTQEEYDVYVRSFREHHSQTGDHLPDVELQMARRVEARPIELARRMNMPGVKYLTRIYQDMEFSAADPSEFIEGDVYVSEKATAMI